MNLPAIFDAISFAGYFAAMAIAVSAMSGPRRMPRASAFLITGAMVIMMFVSVSNLLESSGAFGGLDRFEDYIEVLVFPMLGYAYFLMHMDRQINELRSTINASRAEHDLLVDIMDASRVGIVLIDDVGYVSFSNKFASEVLLITECGSMHECTSEVRVTPVGTPPLDRGVFHETIQGRAIDGERWEIVGPHGRTPVGLTSSPFEGSSGRFAGSVIVLLPLNNMSDTSTE